ncbi:hypothetical protein [Empedobacter brevis]|uniref:hypothetical protein n=1 Tax=Empedobacter brevis TaxID=247 RepID=UPI0028B11213|nr:hypothetical protein [Empedobacter brevis]
MKKIIFILSALSPFYVNAQLHTGIPANNSPNAIVNISSNSRTQIKGFTVPRHSLTSLSGDFLGDPNATNLRNSLLIFNSNSTLTKGLYFWDATEWTNLADTSILNSKLSNLSKINKFSSSATPVTTTYPDGNYTAGAQHTMNELYSSRASGYWTDLNFAEGTVKNIELKNSKNNNILKTSGTIQTHLSTNTSNAEAYIGLALFIKSPGDSDFKLKGYKIISGYMNNSCLNFQFDMVNAVKDLPVGMNEVKIAMDNREIDGPNNSVSYNLYVASRNNNCMNTDSGGNIAKQNFLPASTMITNLVVETYENPNF